ncbi:aminoacyl-tRNA deacylase [Candidatus Leptofilum sp.]|uniref:aminoacyl-tRNA deacylase n=1 Tax=Candidatus Leptofilum sp. TaxID=3241576 RepID=UPI003B5BD10B
MDSLNAADLLKFIDEQGLTAQILHLDVDTPTVAAAAAALDVAPEQIIKSVLFLADKKPVMVIASGLARLDRKALADYLGVSRRRVKIASAAQVLAHTGYVAGSVPPFGYREPIETVVETAVTRLSGPIYGGGGEIHALLRLTAAELRRVVGVRTASLAEPAA